MKTWGLIVFFVAVAIVPKVFAEELLAFPEDARRIPTRIVSGWEAEEGQIPWQLSLRMVNPVGNVDVCCGSIIHPLWGMTAAHCTATRVTMVLRAGAVSLRRPELLFETTEYYNHPLYIDALQTVVQPNDIALLKFPRAITFSDRVQPIRVQRDEDRNQNYDGVRLEASGWGRTWTNGPSPDILQWVYLTGDSNLACWLAFGGSSIIQDSTICASAYNVTSQSTCQGDSGGPLVVEEEDGKYTLVGVASFVSGAGCHTNIPAGFIRPGHYHAWFREVTGLDFDWDYEEPTTVAPTTTTEADSSEEVTTTTEAATEVTTTEGPATTDAGSSSSSESNSEESEEVTTTTEAATEVTTTEGPVTTDPGSSSSSESNSEESEEVTTTTEAATEVTTTEGPATTDAGSSSSSESNSEESEEVTTTTEAATEVKTTEGPATTDAGSSSSSESNSEESEEVTTTTEVTTTEAPTTPGAGSSSSSESSSEESEEVITTTEAVTEAPATTDAGSSSSDSGSEESEEVTSTTEAATEATTTEAPITEADNSSESSEESVTSTTESVTESSETAESANVPEESKSFFSYFRPSFARF